LKYLLDTNICIYIINKKPTVTLKHLMQRRPGDVGVSTITVAELTYGVRKRLHVEKNQRALSQFLIPLEVIEFGEGAATVYGELRALLERAGKIIGPLDMLIAAHALSLGSMLVTNNKKEFTRVPGLLLEDWS
jgi:tRNA(fMet)-specific endonuclease VapC